MPSCASLTGESNSQSREMFNKDHFIQQCINAIPDGQPAMREVVSGAVAAPNAVIAELGEPEHAGLEVIYQSSELTILNFTWAPSMTLYPHNHHMYAVIGAYSGREDNIFWRRKNGTLEVAGAQTLGKSDVATLGREIIHSVTNPIGRMSSALHVYGGDFFNPPEPRSEWNPETLEESQWDGDKALRLFADAEKRFYSLHA